MLWLRTALFTLLVPGTVLGLVPFAFIATSWGPRFNLGAVHLIGFMLLMPGVAIIVWCFIDFVRLGRGTPAPYDPPRRLVVAGLYKYTRNPQYVGVILVACSYAFMKSLRSGGCSVKITSSTALWFRGGCLDAPLIPPEELSDDHAAQSGSREN